MSKVKVNLDRDLRQKYQTRSAALRKDDRVKVMRGQFKDMSGKVLEIDRKNGKVRVEGVEISKADGSKVQVPIHFSNLQIRELELKDKKRKAKFKAKEGEK